MMRGAVMSLRPGKRKRPEVYHLRAFFCCAAWGARDGDGARGLFAGPPPRRRVVRQAVALAFWTLARLPCHTMTSQ